MINPNLILRFLTILTYFLPFIFFIPACTDGLTWEMAYSKTEAVKNEQKALEAKLSSFELLLDSIGENNSRETIEEFRERAHHFYPVSGQLKYLEQDFQYHLMMPTNYSASGIGTVVFHKNTIGRLSIAISLGISILSLLFWPFFNTRRLGTYLIFVNTVIILVFILDCILSDVSILYGTWSLLLLLLSQLITKGSYRDTVAN